MTVFANANMTTTFLFYQQGVQPDAGTINQNKKSSHFFGQSFIILAIVHRKKCQPLQTPFNMHAENGFFLSHAKLFVLGLLK